MASNPTRIDSSFTDIASSSTTGKRKRSNVWLYFNKVSAKEVKCIICKKIFTHSSSVSTSNLLKHIYVKHSSARIEIKPKMKKESVIVPFKGVETEVAAVEPQRNEKQAKTIIQDTLNSFVQRSVSILRQKRLNELLINMIAQDLQSPSVVEDQGFKKFVYGLDPSYELPSRATVTKVLLPSSYDSLKAEVRKQLHSVNSFSLSIVGWTSMSEESYFGYTVHFIDNEFELKNYLLECTKFHGHHTPEKISADIQRVINEWNLQNKVDAIVTDNAENMKAAVKLIGFNHLPCFANTLSLVVQNCLTTVQPLLTKVRQIVKYFDKSSEANEKFMAAQRQLNPNNMAIKLKNDADSLWNSTYDMLVHFWNVREPLEATMDLLQKPVQGLSHDEWSCIEQLCQVLVPFSAIVTEFKEERCFNASVILLYMQALRNKMAKFLKTSKCKNVINLLNTIIDDMNAQFLLFDEITLLAMATFLDPRFKKLGFYDEEPYNRTKDFVTREISFVTNCEKVVEQRSKNIGESDLWDDFDCKVSDLITAPQSSTTLEVQKYVEEPYLGRKENPFSWWRSRRHSYPRLSKLAIKVHSVVATSVPYERDLQKNVQLLSEKRNRLSAKNLNMILFLNFNSTQ